MNKTRKVDSEDIVKLPKLAVTTEELAQMLSCGIATAKSIGEKSEARLCLGERRTLWSVEKVQAHIFNIAG